MLIYEILLMRICALRLFFHFAFLIISNCLLGIGASGTLISICQESFKKRPRFWVSRFSFLYFASLIVTYVFLLTFPIGWQLNLWRFADLARFSAYNLAAALPFFFGGTVVGLILMFNAERINATYFADLLGAGVGCLLCPFLLWKFGAGGCLAFLALLALAGTMFAYPTAEKRVAVPVGIVLGLAGLWLMPTLDQRFPVPGKEALDFTSDLRMSLPQVPYHSAWSTNSRVDVLSLLEEQRFVFGRGTNTADHPPIPEQKLIMQDGTAGTMIVNFSEHPEALEIIRNSMYSAAMHLKERPKVLIIGVGGGNDVWAAKVNDASSVRGIELNQSIIDVHRGVLPNYTKDLVNDPRIQFVCAEGRSALMQDSESYDVIQMTVIDTWTALNSGAYMLAENYLYTREAVESMYEHLAPEGVLHITRVGGPGESLRMLSNIYAALQSMGVSNFEDSVMCVRNPYLIGIIVKKGVFTSDEQDRLAEFTDRAGLTLAYSPRRRTDNLVESFIRAGDKTDYIRKLPIDISPTTDDEPYFFLYARGRDFFRLPSRKAGADYPFQFHPLLVTSQLVLGAVLSFMLIVLPLVIFAGRGIRRTWVMRFLVYFAGLGLGFIFVEIVAMQKLSLFLGHPIYSITVTLFSILMFAGLGSLLSQRWFQPPDAKVWAVPFMLGVLLVLFVLLTPKLVASCIHFPLPLRIAITGGILAPISLLLGVPFAYGIRVVNLRNPSFIPWAWAVNGCCTVIGATLTVILSMNFGFNAVLLTSVVIYLVAFSALGKGG